MENQKSETFTENQGNGTSTENQRNEAFLNNQRSVPTQESNKREAVKRVDIKTHVESSIKSGLIIGGGAYIGSELGAYIGSMLGPMGLLVGGAAGTVLALYNYREKLRSPIYEVVFDLFIR